MKNIERFKPAVPRRVLLFIAAFVWTFAGSMLLYKGYRMLDPGDSLPLLKLSLILIAGILFYLLMFSKLSRKHTRRILEMESDYPCLFSFFNVRSYLVMILMISMGITLRLSGWVPALYLSAVYLTMSVPLLLSSVRFYRTGLFYSRYNGKAIDDQHKNSIQ